MKQEEFEKAMQEHWLARVAERDDLTSEQIDLLSRDENDRVRWGITNHPNLTTEQIERLSWDENYAVRVGIAEREDLTEDQIERLSKDEREEVRVAINFTLQRKNIAHRSRKTCKIKI